VKRKNEQKRMFYHPLRLAENPYRRSDYDPVWDWIPEDGWLAGYMEYTNDCEAPRRFRLACGMGLLSGCILRNLWVPWGHHHAFPNMWFLLIGPPGCGKDTALMQAYEMLVELKKPPRIISDKVSPEMFAFMLGNEIDGNGKVVGKRDAQGVVYALELGVFLGKQKYLEGMIPLLTRFYDSPPFWSYATFAHGIMTLERMCLTMNWATTPDYFAEEMPKEVFEGGFLSRMLFLVYLGEEKRIFMPRKPSRGIKSSLVRYLDKVNSMEGEMTFDTDAYDYFNKWYHTRKFIFEAIPGYWKRRHHHILKLATLYSVSNSMNKIISLQHIKMAMGLMDAIERTMSSEVSEVQLDPEVKKSFKIVRYLNREPYLTDGQERRRVLAGVHRHFGSVEDFDKAIHILSESGQLDIERQGKSIIYKLRYRDEDLVEMEEQDGGKWSGE